MVRSNERIRHVAEVLKGFLECPVAVRDIAELPCDAKSGFLFHRNCSCTSCRKAGCGLPCATISVFCPEHHYQMLKEVDASTE